jgi:WD40 repeat protein
MKCFLKLSAIILFCSLQAIYFAARAQDTSASKSKEVISDVEFSPDQKYLSFATGSKTVKVFEVATGRLQYSLQESSLPVYSKDGKYLATASERDSVKVWEASSGKMVESLKIQTKGHISFIGFSPSGKYVYAIALPSSFVQSFSDYGIITQNSYTTVWETATGKLLHTYDKALYQFTADENHIVYIAKPYAHLDNYLVDVCNTDSVNTHFSFESVDDFPVCSQDGKYILNPRKKNTDVWEMTAGKIVYTIDSKVWWFTKDGKYIVYSDNPDASVDSHKILETATLKLQDAPVCDILSAYESNKDYVLTSSRNKDNIEIWKVDSCKLLQSVQGEVFLQYSADGKYMLGLTGKASGGTVNLRNLATGELVHSLNPPKGKMTDANFSAGGTFIITTNYEKTLSNHRDISIWETASGKLLYSFQVNFGSFGEFTKDEKDLIIVSISDVKICEPYSGKVLYTLY